MTAMIRYNALPAFDKDFKKLHKRFSTLDRDFEIMKRGVIEVCHLQNIKTPAAVKIEGFCCERYLSMKVRKFSCMALKGRGSASGLRVVYVFEPENYNVTFIEIYFKSDKENEDKDRLKAFLKSL
jgi:hypothetical protein